MRQKRPRGRQAELCDLFGEIPVTWSEVAAWCQAVAGIGPESWRFAWYVNGWDVPGKIRQAKLAGTFEATVARPAPASWLGQLGARDWFHRAAVKNPRDHDHPGKELQCAVRGHAAGASAGASGARERAAARSWSITGCAAGQARA